MATAAQVMCVTLFSSAVANRALMLGKSYEEPGPGAIREVLVDPEPWQGREVFTPPVWGRDRRRRHFGRKTRHTF
jgi:hypothetical protein